MENRLNVVIATDTILYTPFYTALYGNDFESTPYGKVKINIIARENDYRFSTDTILNLSSADGFVTMCLIFEYADVGICDPSFLIQISESENTDTLKEAFETFFNTLSSREQVDFKKHSGVFSNNIVNIEKLKNKIDNNYVKVIGGLISKIAFSLIGANNLNKYITNFDTPYVCSSLDCDNDTAVGNFAANSIERLIHPPKPSTGYCLSQILAYKFRKANKNIELITKNFGEEIQTLKKLPTKKNKTIAFSCDFVSIDYSEEKGICEVEDWTYNSYDVLFTGLLANFLDGKNIEKEKAINAFLYAVDKNLYELNNHLKSGKNKLNAFLDSKLNGNNEMKDTLLKLLVSDKTTEDNIASHLDEALYSFSNRLKKLYDEKKYSLYYETTDIKANDLINICKIRFKGYNETKEVNDIMINKYIKLSTQKEWKEDRKNILSWKKDFIKKFFWTKIGEEKSYLLLGAILITIQLFALLVDIFNYQMLDISKISIVFMTYKLELQHLLALSIFILLIVLIVKGQNLLRLKKLEKYLFR